MRGKKKICHKVKTLKINKRTAPQPSVVCVKPITEQVPLFECLFSGWVVGSIEAGSIMLIANNVCSRTQRKYWFYLYIPSLQYPVRTQLRVYNPIEIYHQVQMHSKVSLTQFTQFAWNIWMKSNKEKFANSI